MGVGLIVYHDADAWKHARPRLEVADGVAPRSREVVDIVHRVPSGRLVRDNLRLNGKGEVREGGAFVAHRRRPARRSSPEISHRLQRAEGLKERQEASLRAGLAARRSVAAGWSGRSEDQRPH